MGKQKPINNKLVLDSSKHTNNENIIEQPYRPRPSDLTKVINEILSEHRDADASNKKSQAKHNNGKPSKFKKHIYRRLRMSKSFQEEVTRRISKERDMTAVKPNREAVISEITEQTPTVERLTKFEHVDKARIRKWVDTLEKASTTRSPSEISI